MKIIRRVLTVISMILIILILLFMNYHDLSWSVNRTSYLGLLACLLNIWALVFLMKDIN